MWGGSNEKRSFLLSEQKREFTLKSSRNSMIAISSPKKRNVGQTNGRRIHLRLEGRSLPYLHRPRRRRKPFVDLDSPEVIVYIALPLGCLTLSKELSRICRTFGTSLFTKETELLCSLVSFLTGSFKRHFHIFISYYRILNANQ